MAGLSDRQLVEDKPLELSYLNLLFLLWRELLLELVGCPHPPELKHVKNLMRQDEANNGRADLFTLHQLLSQLVDHVFLFLNIVYVSVDVSNLLLPRY